MNLFKDPRSKKELLIENQLLEEQVALLKNRLEDAKDIKGMFKQFAQEINDVIITTGGNSHISSTIEDLLNEKYIVSDFVTGKTIFKDNANKVIKISINGEITHGFTLEKPDEGYEYKLIR